VIAPWDAPEMTSWRRLPMHTLRHADPAAWMALDGRWRFQLQPTPDTVPALAAAGARRFVVVRWLTEATDPQDAARALRRAVDTAVPA